MSQDRERPQGYYACLGIMLAPIIAILVIPLFTSGLTQLPYALLMLAIVIIPILSCGLEFRGRPLFQFSYHGEPFIDEVMNISDDEKLI